MEDVFVVAESSVLVMLILGTIPTVRQGTHNMIAGIYQCSKRDTFKLHSLSYSWNDLILMYYYNI